jgi:hypothetical protein
MKGRQRRGHNSTSRPQAPHRIVGPVFQHTAHRHSSPGGIGPTGATADPADQAQKAERPKEERAFSSAPALGALVVFATQPDRYLRVREGVHLDEVRRGTAAGELSPPPLQRSIHHTDDLAHVRAKRQLPRPLPQLDLDELDRNLARTPQREHPAVAAHPVAVTRRSSRRRCQASPPSPWPATHSPCRTGFSRGPPTDVYTVPFGYGPGVYFSPCKGHHQGHQKLRQAAWFFSALALTYRVVPGAGEWPTLPNGQSIGDRTFHLSTRTQAPAGRREGNYNDSTDI